MFSRQLLYWAFWVCVVIFAIWLCIYEASGQTQGSGAAALLKGIKHRAGPSLPKAIVLPPSNTHTSNIAWNYSNLSSVASFRLYVGPASRGYTNTTMTGKAMTSKLVWNTKSRNYVAVTAIGTNGAESAFSNELILPTIPATNLVITFSGPTNFSITNPVGSMLLITGRNLTISKRYF